MSVGSAVESLIAWIFGIFAVYIGGILCVFMLVTAMVPDRFEADIQAGWLRGLADVANSLDLILAPIGYGAAFGLLVVSVIVGKILMLVFDLITP